MLTLGSIFTVASNIGYPLLFAIVLIETGCGIPVAPGELALVTAAIAASAGKLSIVIVIVVAAAAAIIGDNVGYLIGRHGGRRLLERPGPFLKTRADALKMGDYFFGEYGPRAVFIGRWLPVLRVYASWMAGGAKMPWTSFVVWNAAGGTCWAITIGLLGYVVGGTAKTIIDDVGIFGIPFVLVGIVLVARKVKKQTEKFAMKVDAQASRAAGGPAAEAAAVGDEPVADVSQATKIRQAVNVTQVTGVKKRPPD